VSNTRTGTGRVILTVGVAGFWVVLCEFVRNQLLLAAQWQSHYRAMGLGFPSRPVNGMMWMVWSFMFAGIAFAVSRRFGLWQTTFIGWLLGWVMMWIVIWNLLVLPVGILPIAIPFSFVEALGAAFICRRLARSRAPGS
jgi:hypothetical protein